MTRILTIVALLFATPAWATKYLNCEGNISLSENIGKPDFRKNSRKTDVLVKMQFAEGKTATDIGKLLGRSRGSIWSKLKGLGLVEEE